MGSPKGVEAVDRALGILECFTTDQTRLPLAELSRQTGFYKSTILRILVSLERFGFVLRDKDGRYRLGPAAWRLGVSYSQGFDFIEELQPALQQLCSTTGETASFYVREQDERLCLHRVEPQRSIRHSIREGATLSLDHGATSKILRAFHTVECPELEQVRKSGFAISLGERDPEVAAISVPVLSSSGRLVGALAVSGLITRFSEERRASLLTELRTVQESLSAQISE